MPTTKHWCTDIDAEVNTKTTLSGPASVPPTTVCESLKRVVRRFPNKPALRVKRDGQWVTWTWKQYYSDIACAAKSMIRVGVEPFRGVCVLGFNCPEWFISYLGGIMAGGVGCGIYTTNNPEACHYIADNCSANIIFAENKLQIAKLLQVRDRLPHLKMIVQYSSEPLDPEQQEQGVVPWREFLEIGKDVPDYEVQWRIEKQKPGTCAALIYTSGTTGPPKGVMISHDNLTWTAAVCASLYGLVPDDHMISYLPLSHVAAQMMDIHAALQCGLTIHFAQPDALKGSLAGTLKEVRPTVFVGVPRVWEKFKDKIEEGIREATGIKEVIMDKARNVGRQSSLNRQSGKPVAWGYWLANTFIFKSLREKMGLERCRIAGSAAAPIAHSVLEFFLDFDIPLYELYGMSESTGPQTLSLIGNHKTGSTGKVMPGAEMKLDKADDKGDGEICFRGRHVFMGYLNEERKTREAIDEDGWLHSGDIGRVDKDGYLFITGRIKELLITRGGENVAPVPIEERMLDQMKLLSRCMVVGDNQKYLAMLVALRTEVDSELRPTEQLDSLARSILQDLGSTSSTVSEAASDPIVAKYINDGVVAANAESVSRAAKVQKFRILPLDFSIGGGELTPTLKLKRKVVAEKYSGLVEDMYRD